MGDKDMPTWEDLRVEVKGRYRCKVPPANMPPREEYRLKRYPVKVDKAATMAHLRGKPLREPGESEPKKEGE